MRPLLLHASSSCATPKSRRVIHLEFVAAELPHGLDWHDRFQLNSRIPSLSPDFNAVTGKVGFSTTHGPLLRPEGVSLFPTL
jgi:hypothetical protein